MTRRDLGFEAWQDWQAEIARKLGIAIAFFYGNFVQGVRRAVIDGIEPAERPSESIQFELFEYVYHQILRKDAEWVAVIYFANRSGSTPSRPARTAYPSGQVACLLL